MVVDKDPEAPVLEMSYHAGCHLVVSDMEPCCDKIGLRISTPIRHVIIGPFSRRKTLSPCKYRCLAAEPRRTIESGIALRCAPRSVAQVPAMLRQPCVYEAKVLGPSVPEGDICVCVGKGCG